MQTWPLLVAIFCGIAVAQSFFLAAYLMVRENKRNSPGFFLGLMLVGLALRISKSYFFFVIHDLPQWWAVLGAAGLWAVGPSFLLYTKASKPVPVSRRDHLHYTPALLILVLPTLVPSVNLGFYYHIGVGHFLIYFLAALWYFHHGQWTGSKKRFRLFAGSMGGIALTFLVQTAIGGIQVYALGTLLTLLVLYVVNFLILLDSRYLQERKSKKAGKHLLKGIGKDLERLFREEKLYRRKGLTLAEVARLTGHPAYLVSQTVNEYHGLKFNQFVNRFRIEEVKQRLRDLEANDKIEVIAVEVGFSSTSSLYAAFKRETDSTPQAFRRQFIHS